MDTVQNATKISASLDNFIRRGYANHDAAHDYNHAVRVYENAEEITAGENITLTEQETREFPYVMLGHDLRDHKLEATGRCLPEKEIKIFYVKSLGVKSAEKIIHIHANCSWSKRTSSEPLETGDWMRLVLQDADWLDALGTQGVERCVAFTKTFSPPSTDIQAAVCQHIREKLLHIPSGLTFATSRKIVEEKKLLEPLLEYLALNEKRS